MLYVGPLIVANIAAISRVGCAVVDIEVTAIYVPNASYLVIRFLCLIADIDIASHSPASVSDSLQRLPTNRNGVAGL